MHLGVAYYPEHWPEERWPRDARLMREAGIRRVRIAEFAWHRLEPREGEYDFDWLHRAIRVLEREDIGVILCTPTPTYPAWLHRKHPDIHQLRSDGRAKEFGQRQDACKNHPGYRAAARRIVDEVVGRFGDDPAVVAWQTDNEFGCHGTIRCWCGHCERAFQEWLRARYDGDIERLNEAWGTVVWSQEYNGFEEVSPPRDTADLPGPAGANPGLVLDFYRFSSDTQAAFQHGQVEVIRRHSPGRLVTHNFMHYFYQLDYFDLARDLDVVAWDNYPYFAAGTGRPPEPLPFALMHGFRRRNVWVMEQASGPGGWGTFAATPRPGEMRLWAWQAAARGADMVSFFRWRTARFGREQFWHGLLPHHGEPGARYAEARRLGSEMAKVSARLEGTQPVEEAALLFDYTSLWALEVSPQVAPPPVGEPGYGYTELAGQWLRALAGLGASAAVLPVDGDPGGIPLLLAPTLHVVPDGLAARLEDYVRAGGTLVLGPRSGVKDAHSTVVDAVLPGALRAVAGATVEDYDAFSARPRSPRHLALRDSDGGAHEGWAIAESLVPEGGAEVLLTWVEGSFAGKPAAVRHRLGRGACVLVGTVLDDASCAWLLRELLPGLRGRPLLPPALEVVRRARPDGGGVVTFYLNHSDGPVEVPGDARGTDLLTGTRWSGTTTLGPCGVAIVAE